MLNYEDPQVVRADSLWLSALTTHFMALSKMMNKDTYRHEHQYRHG